MIKYLLKCNDCDQEFESWFGSSEEYDKLRKLKLLNCQYCDSLDIKKSLMSPNLFNTKKKEIVIKMNQILMDKFDWKKISGHEINLDDYAYLGAPFITNCRYWSEVYQKTINLVKTHNTTRDGLFKLFTMSLQNILFYRQIIAKLK